MNTMNLTAFSPGAMARVDEPGISTVLRVLALLSAVAAALSLIIAAAMSLIVWGALG
jgi:hypothetical protein